MEHQAFLLTGDNKLLGHGYEVFGDDISQLRLLLCEPHFPTKTLFHSSESPEPYWRIRIQVPLSRGDARRVDYVYGEIRMSDIESMSTGCMDRKTVDKKLAVLPFHLVLFTKLATETLTYVTFVLKENKNMEVLVSSVGEKSTYATDEHRRRGELEDSITIDTLKELSVFHLIFQGALTEAAARSIRSLSVANQHQQSSRLADNAMDGTRGSVQRLFESPSPPMTGSEQRALQELADAQRELYFTKTKVTELGKELEAKKTMIATGEKLAAFGSLKLAIAVTRWKEKATAVRSELLDYKVQLATHKIKLANAKKEAEGRNRDMSILRSQAAGLRTERDCYKAEFDEAVTLLHDAVPPLIAAEEMKDDQLLFANRKIVGLHKQCQNYKSKLNAAEKAEAGSPTDADAVQTEVAGLKQKLQTSETRLSQAETLLRDAARDLSAAMEKEQELSDLRTETDIFRSQLEGEKAQLSSALERLDDVEVNVALAAAQDAELSTVKGEAAALRDELDSCKERLATADRLLRDAMDDLARSAATDDQLAALQSEVAALRVRLDTAERLTYSAEEELFAVKQELVDTVMSQQDREGGDGSQHEPHIL